MIDLSLHVAGVVELRPNASLTTDQGCIHAQAGARRSAPVVF